MKRKTHALIPETHNGKTHLVRDPNPLRVPRPPRDWDAIVLRLAVGTTAVAVGGSVVWSAVSIGELLSMVAQPWTAYLVAGVFDVAWITCMLLEWINRYDRDRASLPRTAGWFALLISMSLITFHGQVRGSLAIGLCGALVSALAKGMWTLVMHQQSVSLSPQIAEWLRIEREEAGAALAMQQVQRELDRTRSKTNQLALSLDLGQSFVPVPLSPGQADSVPGTVSRTQDSGQADSPTVPDTRTVPRTQDTVPVPLSPGQADTVPDNGTDEVRQVRTGSIAGFVLALVSEGRTDAEITDAVRRTFGSDTKINTIKKSIARMRDRVA